MNTNNVNQKLSTGIAGLDAIFHGGIHIHNSDESHKGIIMLARGQHGVNKIHLSMQICEGLHDSAMTKIQKEPQKWKEVVVLILYAVLSKNMSFGVGFKNKVIKLIDEQIEFLVCFRQHEEKNMWLKRKEDLEKVEEYNKWVKSSKPIILINLAKTLVDFYKLDYSKCVDKEQNNIDALVTDCINELNKIQVFSEEQIINYLTIDILKDVFDEQANQPPTLFVSINKDSDLLKNSYYDFYLQRLIRDIRIDVDAEHASTSLLLLHAMLWNKVETGQNIKKILDEYEFPSITGKIPSAEGIVKFKDDIKTGFIYYNGRTHSLHVRHQKGAKNDYGEMLVCKLELPDDYKVKIIGKDTLNNNVDSADALTTFQNMMRVLDGYKDNNNRGNTAVVSANKQGVDFIMIDGLSRLNEEELTQCPLNALSDKLRSKSKVAIITADKKLLPSNISTDIVLDMEILQSERPDHQYTALKVSKCLYQKNAYGWHRYKMRNAGIEVIPSIHLQMGQRFLMDDVVTDASCSINEFPYPYWLNENNITYYDDKKIEKERREKKGLDIDDNIKDISDAKNAYYGGDKIVCEDGTIYGFVLTNSGTLIERINSVFRIETLADRQHILFVNFDNNRSSFYSTHIQSLNIDDKVKKRIHLFNFQPGYIPADEFLWSIDQQVQSIEKIARKTIDKEEEEGLATHYKHVNLIIGDLNYIHYAYPCLSAESLLLPALATYTKKHHMTNYVYATVNQGKDVEDTDLHKKEIETIMQMRRITNPFDDNWLVIE